MEVEQQEEGERMGEGEAGCTETVGGEQTVQSFSILFNDQINEI